jgi:hypothetical protein
LDWGRVQASSMCLTNGPTTTSSTGLSGCMPIRWAG